MTRVQRENISEIWEELIDLAGDIIALQTFLFCKDECLEQFGGEMCGHYLKRIGDYIDQNTGQIRQIRDILVIPELKQLLTDEATGRAM